MYAYTFSKRMQRIVGTVDSKQQFDDMPVFIKEDIELCMPDQVYDKNDEPELKLQKLFDKANVYWEFWEDNGQINIDIDGDWKHDHGFCDNLMESLGYRKIDEFLLEPSEDDWYNARHIYKAA